MRSLTFPCFAPVTARLPQCKRAKYSIIQAPNASAAVFPRPQVSFARQELQKRSLAMSCLKLSIFPLVVAKEVYVDISTYLFNKRQVEILQSMFSPARGALRPAAGGGLRTPLPTPRGLRPKGQVRGVPPWLAFFCDPWAVAHRLVVGSAARACCGANRLVTRGTGMRCCGYVAACLRRFSAAFPTVPFVSLQHGTDACTVDHLHPAASVRSLSFLEVFKLLECMARALPRSRTFRAAPPPEPRSSSPCRSVAFRRRRKRCHQCCSRCRRCR